MISPSQLGWISWYTFRKIVKHLDPNPLKTKDGKPYFAPLLKAEDWANKTLNNQSVSIIMHLTREERFDEVLAYMVSLGLPIKK